MLIKMTEISESNIRLTKTISKVIRRIRFPYLKKNFVLKKQRQLVMGSAILDLCFTILHFSHTIFFQRQLNPHHFSEKKSNWLMLRLFFLSLPTIKLDVLQSQVIQFHSVSFFFIFFFSSKHDNAGE
jgi:hypothetical protein